MTFKRPAFVLSIGLQKKESDADASKSVQKLFGDILSRAKVKNFKLVEGSFSVVRNEIEPAEIVRIGKINLDAKDIETDSMQWKHPIPFKLGEISTSVEDIVLIVNEHSTFKCGSIVFNPQNSSLSINHVSMKFNKDWVKVSELLGECTDLIELELKSLVINGIEAKSQLFGDIDIRSESIIIDNCILRDYKNKNLPRLNERIQAMFSGMVAAIPFDLRVDTIQIINSFVSYAELGVGKEEAGAFNFDKLNGAIYNFTTIDSFQTIYKEFELNAEGKFNDAGHLTFKLTVPYAVDEFYMTGTIENLKVAALNSTLQPLAGIVAESGTIHLLRIDMRATTESPQNHLIFNYDSLKINVLKADEEELKKRGFVSMAANSMVRKQNMPGDADYLEIDYLSERNIRRAAFTLMYVAMQEGLIEILPTNTAKKLIAQAKKKKEKKAEKGK